MASSQSNRSTRSRGIPRNLVNNWQCPGTHNQQVLIRRPITACEPCRAAKVKCDGQSPCSRCKSRGLVCNYAPSAKISVSRSDQPTEALNSVPEAPNGTVSSPILSSHTDKMMEDPSEISTEWARDVDYPSSEIFDWNALDLGIGDVIFDQLADSGLNDPAVSTSSSASTLAPSLSTNPQFSDPFDTNKISMSSYFPLGQSPQELLPATMCECRSGLMMNVPRVLDVMRERPKPMVDKVFGVARDIIKGCQDTLHCSECQISSVDLIWITGVFQQTGSCFEYLSSIGPNQNTKVSIGEFEVATDDALLTRILVTSLVEQADVLLTSLDTLGETMFSTVSLPDRLSRVNLEYLQEVIKSFRSIFQLINNKN